MTAINKLCIGSLLWLLSVSSKHAQAMQPCEDHDYYTYYNPIMAPVVDLRVLGGKSGVRGAIATGATYAIDPPNSCRGGAGPGIELEYDSKEKLLYGLGLNGYGDYGMRVTLLYKRSFLDQRYHALTASVGVLGIGVIIGYEFGRSALLGIAIGGGFTGFKDEFRKRP